MVSTNTSLVVCIRDESKRMVSIVSGDDLHNPISGKQNKLRWNQHELFTVDITQ